ncbi:hypothetical protein OGAPHI_003375 [Ogataea philodendri]|uniref:Protein MAK11 n=1 Tax=Ogataea philodendri TaxID=1378263 RepID=A0A9P8P8F1_9ASCO|nr:uncharacterized protein OGAPHI_003375 [Ogataea philodendri]KAH3666925.1 hypothetical protein OGAPHI_003375 [Ogataea philodendri]
MTIFRIITGSYEHALLCVSVTLADDKTIQPVFQPIFHFQAHSLSIRALDIAKRYLVSGSNDEHIKIYDLQKRKELGTLLQHQGSITKLLFSDDTAEESDFLTHKNGRWLLSAAEDGKIVIWRTKDWEQFGILKGHTARVNDMAIHPSGRVAISVSDDKTVRLWNLMTAKKASVMKLKGVFTHGQSPNLCCFTSDGEYFAVGLLNRLIIYETREAKIVAIFQLKQTLMQMQFVTLDNREYLVVANGNGTIQFYTLERVTQKNEETEPLDTPEFQLQGHANRVKDISIYKEKQNDEVVSYLVSISSDGKIVIWDLKLKDQVAVYDTGERLNVVATVNESVEKALRPRPSASTKEVESEYESDGEVVLRRADRKKIKKRKKKLLKVERE